MIHYRSYSKSFVNWSAVWRFPGKTEVSPCIASDNVPRKVHAVFHILDHCDLHPFSKPSPKIEPRELVAPTKVRPILSYKYWKLKGFVQIHSGTLPGQHQTSNKPTKH